MSPWSTFLRRLILKLIMRYLNNFVGCQLCDAIDVKHVVSQSDIITYGRYSIYDIASFSSMQAYVLTLVEHKLCFTLSTQLQIHEDRNTSCGQAAVMLAPPTRHYVWCLKETQLTFLYWNTERYIFVKKNYKLRVPYYSLKILFVTYNMLEPNPMRWTRLIHIFMLRNYMT